MLVNNLSREKGTDSLSLVTSREEVNVGFSSVVNTASQEVQTLRRQILLVRFWGRELATRVGD